MRPLTPPPASEPYHCERTTEELIRDAQAGSRVALGKLLEGARTYLLVAANRALDSNLRPKAGASDVVQETFVNAQQDFDKFRGRTAQELFAWLSAILDHRLANNARHFRSTQKRNVRREIPIELTGGLVNGLCDPQPTPGTATAAREEERRVKAAIELLPAPLRDVLVERTWMRTGFAEIGAPRLFGRGSAENVDPGSANSQQTSRRNIMTADEYEAQEDALADMLVQYDDALARNTPQGLDDSETTSWDQESVLECEQAKRCIEMLDRVRRTCPPPDLSTGSSDGATSVAVNVELRDLTLGRYRIEREVGRGGLGVVYLAFDTILNRQVALKVPRVESLVNGDLRRRFLREAEAAARLSHPNLLTVFEAGEHGVVCYIAAEYCAGPNLSQWLRSERTPVAPRTAARAIQHLALAVQHAHGRGVLHRDIKPSNILLGAADDEDLPWQPKLADFGMAKLLESTGDETRSGAIIGTPAYMAPEQAEGRTRDLDARTDVYALGAVLYEMLTGRGPAEGESDVVSLRKVLCEDPVPPRQLRREIPSDLEAICLKCLARERERRYTTAQELGEDLERFLSGQATRARTLAVWERGWKWARRRPTVATLAMMTALAMVSAAVVGAAYTVRLRQHAEELTNALAARDEARATAQSHVAVSARAYPVDLRNAQQAWNEGRVGDATILLEKHLRRSGEPDHRSFAWHFLWRLCHLDGPTVKGHEGPVYTCSYSPDGGMLASAGEDGIVRLWNVPLRTLDRSWTTHHREVDSITFSPEGNLLATTTADGAAAVWDTAKGVCVHQFGPTAGAIHGIGFMPDGQTLVAGGDKGVLSFLNVADWSLRSEQKGLGKPIQLLAVSSDGTLLATTALDELTITLWNAKEMRAATTFTGHTREILAISFSHDGSMLASASRDATIKVWDIAAQREHASFGWNGGYVYNATFTPDDRWVLATTRDGIATFWEVSTGKQRRVLRSESELVHAAAISPDGRELATGGTNGLIQFWNGSPQPATKRLLHDEPGRDMALAPDERTIAVGDYDGNVNFYDAANGEFRKKFNAHKKRIHSLCFSDRGDMLATVCEDVTVRLWAYPELTLLHKLDGHDQRVWQVRFSPDGTLAATCSSDQTVKVWDTRTGALRYTLQIADVETSDIAFSPDGRLMASAGFDPLVRIWKVSDGTQLAVLTGHKENVSCIAWSPDGKLLASGGKIKGEVQNGNSDVDVICLWDTTNLELAGRIVSNQAGIESVTFSPDSKTLASGALGSIKLWDVASQEQILVLSAHSGEVAPLIFTAQGDALYSFATGQPCELFFWPTRVDVGRTLP